MGSASDQRIAALRELSATLQHEFRSIELIERALVHSSMGNAGKANYERLEFLGDAILGFLVAEHLFRITPEIPEGELTDRRAKIVSREPLAEIGQTLGLARYVEAGRGLSSEELHSTRILADLVEAVLAAIYLDGGIRAARRFVRLHVLPHPAMAAAASGTPRDPKSRFLHFAQAQGLGQPEYVTLGHEGPDHARTFTVSARLGGEEIATGSARSKRAAEMIAAEDALKTLRGRAEPAADG